jgi:hypothetical protein
VLRPDVVWFLVSDGKSGESSASQIESLKLTDGCPAQPQVLGIPADDPDAAYKKCRAYLAQARKLHPDHRVIADYTGGTKSMTGALLMAAFAQPGVEVQFMVGERADLAQVKPGSEKPQLMAADFIMAERDFAAAETGRGRLRLRCRPAAVAWIARSVAAGGSEAAEGVVAPPGAGTGLDRRDVALGRFQPWRGGAARARPRGRKHARSDKAPCAAARDRQAREGQAGLGHLR